MISAWTRFQGRTVHLEFGGCGWSSRFETVIKSDKVSRLVFTPSVGEKPVPGQTRPEMNRSLNSLNIPNHNCFTQDFKLQNRVKK